MKLNTKAIRAIKKWVRENIGPRDIEVGFRNWPNRTEPDSHSANFLLWGADNDLDDTARLEDCRGVEIADYHGFVALDLYVHKKLKHDDGELDCNVYVLIDIDGSLVYASDNDMDHTKSISRILRDSGVEPPTFN